MKNRFLSVRRLSTVAAFALLAATGVRPAAAADLNVPGGQTISITTNQGYDNVLVGTSAGTATVNHSAGTVGVSGAINVSATSGNVGIYNLSGTGVLNATGTNFTIGNGGTGTFMQSGSSALNAPNTFLTVSNGSYSLGGTATVNAATLVAGGSYAQTGGTAVFGVAGVYTSSFNLSGGTFTSTGALTVGVNSTATANQSGTSAVTAGNVVLGDAQGDQIHGFVIGTGTYNLDGGTLTTGSISTAAVSGRSGTGTLNLNGGTLAASGASTAFINNVTRANVRGGGAVIDTNGFNVTVPQALAHSNVSGDAATDGGLIKSGAGTLTLSGANTYTGRTFVIAGTLQAGVASVAGVSGAFGNNSAVTLANVAGATLDLNGFNTQIGALSGGGTTGGNVTLGTATLTVGGNNASPAAYAGSISGTGGLTKIGTGILTLTGSNPYAGATAVNGGTLAVNGALTGAGAVTVGNGGTLAGTGTVAGSVAVAAGGTFSPGQLGTGKLTLQSTLTLNGAATAAFLLTSTGSTQALVAGQVNLGTTATLTLIVAGGFTPAGGTKFFLLDQTGTSAAVVGTFANAPLSGSQFTQNGVTYQINYLDRDPADTSNALLNDISVTVVPAAVPEPSTWAMLGLGVVGAGVATLRRRQRAA